MQYLLFFLAKIDFYFLVLKMGKNTDEALQSYVLDCFMYKKWTYINRLLLMQRKASTDVIQLIFLTCDQAFLFGEELLIAGSLVFLSFLL